MNDRSRSGAAGRRRGRPGRTFSLPLHLVRGAGSRLWDAGGRECIDCFNNAVSVGHCHPRVVDALCRQAATLNAHTRHLHGGIVELAERLAAGLSAISGKSRRARA